MAGRTHTAGESHARRRGRFAESCSPRGLLRAGSQGCRHPHLLEGRGKCLLVQEVGPRAHCTGRTKQAHELGRAVQSSAQCCDPAIHLPMLRSPHPTRPSAAVLTAMNQRAVNVCKAASKARRRRVGAGDRRRRRRRQRRRDTFPLLRHCLRCWLTKADECRRHGGCCRGRGAPGGALGSRASWDGMLQRWGALHSSPEHLQTTLIGLAGQGARF